MKEELQGKLVEILTSIQAAAGKASDFALEQLPEIAQSYVAYGRAVSVLHLVVSLAVLALVGIALRWLWRNPWYSTWSWDQGKNVRADTNWAAMSMTLVVGAVVLGVTVSNITSAALVWFAPKVWLLKEIASLLK